MSDKIKWTLLGAAFPLAVYMTITGMVIAISDPSLTQTQVFIKIFTWYL